MRYATSKGLELMGCQSSLTQYAAQGADGYFSMTRNNRCEHSLSSLLGELDVATFLADFNEACRCEPAGDLSIR